MTRAALILAALAATVPGCIYYEGNGDCAACGWNGGDGTDDTAAPTGDDTGTDPTTAFSLRIDPSEVAQGQSLIASITVSEGEADLSTVTAVRFFGATAVTALQPRADEVLLGLSVPHDAATGADDALVEFADGTAVFIEGAITVTEAAPDTGSGSGTGSGDGGNGCP